MYIFDIFYIMSDLFIHYSYCYDNDILSVKYKEKY